MAATSLTPIQIPKGYAIDGVAVTFTAIDATDGGTFTSTGREILLVQNTDEAAQTVSVTSVADEKGRTGDITDDSIAAGGFAVYQQFPQDGWADSDGLITVKVSDVALKVAVLRLQP